MKSYNLGDRVTLEFRKATQGCAGCFFNDCNAEGCDAYCNCIDGKNIWVKIDENISETQTRNTFKEGAIQGISLFKANLWHDVSEEPIPHGDEVTKVCPYVECIIDINGRFCIRPWNTVDKCWDDEEADDFFCEMSEIKRWAYLSDILPAEKGGDR